MQTYQKRQTHPLPGHTETLPETSLPTGGGALTDGASRLDLPEAMRAKMENAFGADLSGVRFYQSERVAESGANAVAMGNAIAFAPGKFDMSSQSGQALLGHELSHVVSQQRGEVRGSGLLNDAALEARADREGAMAAAGEQVYSGPVTPLSGSSVSSVSGPMQCKKGGKKSLMPELIYNDQSPSALSAYAAQATRHRSTPEEQARTAAEMEGLDQPYNEDDSIPDEDLDELDYNEEPAQKKKWYQFWK